MRILLTDGLQRKTLAAARALGRAGHEVFVSEYTGANPSRYSKFCTGFLKSPHPGEEPEAYMAWLMETLHRYKIKALIPMDDITMGLVVFHQKDLSELTGLLVPTLEAYLKASDKGEALIYGKKCGAQCPETLQPQRLEELDQWQGKVSFPALLKPRNRSGSRGIRKVESWEALGEAYKKAADEKGPLPLLQTYIQQGTRYDVCLLYDSDSQCVASFVQRELRQFPEPMGPSTVQESVRENELLSLSQKIMTELQWKGIAELEFMENPLDRKFYFMEINTRFWASLQCAISAGVDFPVLYLKAMTHEAKPQHDYQLGIKCRWLFPGDLLRLLMVRNKGVWEPSFWAGRKKGVVDDIYDPKDPLPVWGVGLSILRFIFDVKMWKAFIWR